MIAVLYEDEYLVVINKPPGLVVNRAHTVAEQTVQDWFAEYLGQVGLARVADTARWRARVPTDFSPEFGHPLDIWHERTGIGHRLDKETSGALVLAKDPATLVTLLRQFKERQVHKRYLCLVHGKLTAPADTIELPIGRAGHDKLKFAVQPDGKPATTRYEVVEYFPQLNLEKAIALPSAKGANLRKKANMYQGFSLVRCWPETGRTHQIRVHFAHLRHPLVGDNVYVGRKRAAVDHAWCPRHFLHAEWLEFPHPVTGEVLAVTAPLTEDLQVVLELLD